ncbi:MAG: hypothetical protein ACRDP6_20140 [Actinoallomurus sp.]
MSHDGGGFSGGHHGGFSAGHHHGGFGDGGHHHHHHHGVDLNGDPIVPLTGAGGGRWDGRLAVVVVILALTALALLIANSG